GMMRNTADPTEVADRLHSAAIHLLRAVRLKDQASGLTPARLSALSVLYFAGPLTLSKLAEAEQVRLPSVSRLVKDMEREGLVSRETAEKDARASLIAVTPKGKALFERARVNRLMALAEALEDLSEEKRATLMRAAELMEAAAKTVRGV
ncbi:MAG TPA: MarR family transcriptional regulator, partial [Sphingomonadales bacterium]|nr:MarR family transcriptional regulator [Sphingomonadales bacterium]